MKESERQTKNRLLRCLSFFFISALVPPLSLFLLPLSLSLSLSLETSLDKDEAVDSVIIIIAGRDSSASARRNSSSTGGIGPEESMPTTAASTNNRRRRFEQRLPFSSSVPAQAPRRLRLRRRFQPPRDPRCHAGWAGGRRRRGEEKIFSIHSQLIFLILGDHRKTKRRKKTHPLRRLLSLPLQNSTPPLSLRSSSPTCPGAEAGPGPWSRG